MLEILLLVGLCKRISRMVGEKGRKAGGYIGLTIGLWIGGEILGFIVGQLLDMGGGAYAFALFGAGLGALAAYWIARSVSSLKEKLPDAAVFD
jgi:hypothetical protein